MKKMFLILSFILAALFLLPGVMGSEGWGETLEISGEVTVAEETTDESEEGDAEADSESDSAGSESSGSSNSPQQKQIKPNTDNEDDNIIWIVDMNLD